MSRDYLVFFLVFGVFSFVNAKSIVDCRIVTGGTTECNQYSSKFIHAKEIRYDTDRKKLIISRTLPTPQKKKVRVVSIADMIERYVNVEDSLRFAPSEDSEPIVTVSKEKITLVQKVDIQKPKKKVNIRVVGTYKVTSGDTLSSISSKFGFGTEELLFLNALGKKPVLKVGQRFRIPLSQKMIDAITSAQYHVEQGDTLISIAQKFKLSPKKLAKFNNIKSYSSIRTGKTLDLPLPYIIKKIEAKKKKLAEKKRIEEKKRLAKQKKAEAKKKKLAKKQQKVKLIRGFGKRKLRVTATAYTSHKNQTDSTPFLAAWNNRLRPGMRIIAVSRDMLTRYGMRNGTKVRISGLRGYYTVRDKMNKRYKKRIDIYMGLDRRRALRWGRRSVIIYW